MPWNITMKFDGAGSMVAHGTSFRSQMTFPARKPRLKWLKWRWTNDSSQSYCYNCPIKCRHTIPSDNNMVTSNHFTHTLETRRVQTKTMVLEEDADGTLVERESTMRFSIWLLKIARKMRITSIKSF